MQDAIKFELVETNYLTRWPCHVCGGCTEKHSILAEVTEGPFKGFRACETCMKKRDFDAKLTAQAERLEEQAACLRAAVGRLQIPTFEEWKDAINRYEKEWLEHYNSQKETRHDLD
jgi:hypothetical protein